MITRGFWALAALFTLAGSLASAAGTVQIEVGSAAPAISEPTARGPFDSTTSGRPYLVEFFAVWCPHCQREVPVVNALDKAYGNRIDVIAIPASPFGFDKSTLLTDADLKTFEERYNVTYRVGFDGFFSSSYDYGVAALPTFYVVGTDRHVLAVESGEVPLARLQADVDLALNPAGR